MNIILIVYKIEKGKGSEDGTGYNIAKRLVDMGNNVTLISRVNNIEKLKKDPLFQNVNLVGIDVPKPFSYIKKKGRGIIIYYYLWQYYVGRLVNSLQDNEQVDIIHQLNFHGDWAPHFIKKKTAKILYGPIVHNDPLPFDFQFGNRPFSAVKEFFKKMAKSYFWHIDPFVKKTAHNTDVVFYGNNNIAPPYQKYRDKITFLPYGGSVFTPHSKKDLSTPFQVLFVGRFINVKGCMAVLDAFAQFSKKAKGDIRLTLVGEGELENQLKKQADTLNIAPQVTFVPWVDQDKLKQYYRATHVFLFPSFEPQGLVVSEALSQGCPVIFLEKTGPAYLAGEAGFTVPQGPYQTVVNNIVEQLEIVYSAFLQKIPYQELVNNAVNRYEMALTWDVIATHLKAAYRNA